MSDSRVPVTALSRGGGVGLSELAARYLEEYMAKIELACARLDEDTVWWRPASGTNSVGNLILHLRGNLLLWILESLGGEPYERRRSEEFTADHTHTKAELLRLLSDTVASCCTVVRGLEMARLGEPLEVQTYDTDVLGAVFHAVEHMSYHTGQILWIVKRLDRGEETLEFYPRHADE